MHSHHQARDEHEEEGEGAPDKVDLSVTGVQEKCNYLQQLQASENVCQEVCEGHRNLTDKGIQKLFP